MRRSRQLRDDPLEAAARSAAAGDTTAWSELCEALCNDVWRYCWAIVADRDLADEATQETFVRATTAIRRFRGDAPVKAWFFVIARRCVADALTRHRRRIDLADALPPPRPSGEPSGMVETTMLIEALDTDSREAFVLTQLIGLTYAEAAQIAQCPVGTIRSRVFRARSELIDAHGRQTATPRKPTQDLSHESEIDDVEPH